MNRQNALSSNLGLMVAALFVATMFFIMPSITHAATFVENQTTANVSEVKASRTLTVDATPADNETVTIGDCVVTFDNVAGATTDELDCGNDNAVIDINTGAGNVARTAADTAAIMHTLTGLNQGTRNIGVSATTTTTVTYTTTGTESVAGVIIYTDGTTGDIDSTGSTSGVIPVAQVVTFTPATPTANDVFAIDINGRRYTQTNVTTVQAVVEGLQPKVTADVDVNCTENNTLVECTAATAGTAFTFDASVYVQGSGGGGSSNNDDDEEDTEEAIDDARQDLDDARDEVADADEDDGDVEEAENLLDDAEDLLDEAEEAFDDEDYDDAMDLVEEAEDLIDEALDEIGVESNDEVDEDSTEEAIDDARSALDDARDEVEDMDDEDEQDEAEDLLNDADNLLDDAEEAFDDEDYDDAMDLVNEAEDLIDEALGNDSSDDEDEDEDEDDSMTDNEKLIADLMKQLAALQAQMGGSVSGGFTMDLTIGSEGAEVTKLQNWLIAQGHAIAAGATGYFGAQTQAALAAYQAKAGISPAAGYFGPVTRAHVNAK